MSDQEVSRERSGQSVLRRSAAVEFDRWETPEFAPDTSQGAMSPGVSITELEALQKQAFDEAYAAGLKAGQEAGVAKNREQAQRFAALVEQLARPFKTLDECVEKQVVQLAMIVARNIIRRELKTDPSHVIGAVREALAVLPVNVGDVQVKLHPEDAALVRKYLQPVEGERAWQLIEDPLLTRGGCRVVSEYSRIDASVEARLAALIATIVGDERAPDDTACTGQKPA
ncbi:MAG: flagellar assembly protein FliH [Gammaproteobacteria bacterium]|nr:flagellar assembly protein FliH [Gammaproteobacteria bacterium]